MKKQHTEDNPVSGPSKTNKHNQDQFHKPDIISKYKESTLKEKHNTETKPMEHSESMAQKEVPIIKNVVIKDELMDADEPQSDLSFTSQSREYLERRLKIEEEVTFVSFFFTPFS